MLLNLFSWFGFFGWFHEDTPYPGKKEVRRFKAQNPDTGKIQFYTFKERQIFWKLKHSSDFDVPNPRYSEKAFNRAGWLLPTHALKQIARRQYLETVLTPSEFQEYGDNLLLFCGDSSTNVLSGTVYVGKKPGVPAYFFYPTDPNDKRVVFFYKKGLNYWSGWKFNAGRYSTLMKYRYLQIAK